MGLSVNTFTYDGTDEFELNFAGGYSSRSDVSCYKDGDVPVDIDFDWLTDNQVRIDDSELEIGDLVKFRRTVSKTSLPVDLKQPSNLTRENVETAVWHTMYAFHEILDGRFGDLVEVNDATYSLVEESVRFALSNFLFSADFKQEWIIKPTFTDLEQVHWTTGGYTVDTSEVQVFVNTPPSETVEFIMSHQGVVVYAATVDTAGVVTPTTVTEFDSTAGNISCTVAGSNFTSGMSAVVVMPVQHTAVLDFDTVLPDFVDIFETARTA